MSRLQIIDAKKMDKLLFKSGFRKVRQKGSHVFIDTLMGELRLSLIILVEI